MRRRKTMKKKTTSRPSPNRKMLIAYLQYAVDDIAVLNDTSATLVKVAIDNLKRSHQSSQR